MTVAAEPNSRRDRRHVLTAKCFAKCSFAVEVGASDKKSGLFVPPKNVFRWEKTWKN